MSTELYGIGETSGTFYFRARLLSNNTWWNGSAWETWDDTHVASYTITGTRQGTTDQIVGTNPAPTVPIEYELYKRAGGSPSLSDSRYWTDTAGPLDANMSQAGGQTVTATTAVNLDNIALLRRCLIGATYPVAGTIAVNGVPLYNNLSKVALQILHGLAQCTWNSDSTGSIQTTPRIRRGLIRYLGVDWLAIYGRSDSSSSDEGANYGGSYGPVTVQPGASMPDGTSNDSALPLSYITLPNIGNAAQITTYYADFRTIIPNSQSEIPRFYPSGDWTAGQQTRCRILWRRTTNEQTQVKFSGQRFSIGSLYDTLATVAAFGSGHYAIDVDVTDPTAAVSTTQADGLQLIVSTGNAGETRTGKYWATNGFIFYKPHARKGFSLAHISEGGWSTTDHLSPLNSGGDAAFYDSDGKYTNAQLVTAYNSLDWGLGWPNIEFFHLGINFSNGESNQNSASKAVYKANLLKIIQRRRYVRSSNGKPKAFYVLISPYATSEDTTTSAWRNLQAEAVYELSCEYPDDIGSINLHGWFQILLKSYGNWSSSYTSDGIHLNAAGNDVFAQIIASCLNDAASLHGMTRQNFELARRLEIDSTLAPASLGTGSALDRVMNKNSNKTFDSSTDSQEAVADAQSSVSTSVSAIGTLVTAVSAKLGGFAGTATSTVFGWLRALARKDVAAPDDLGGTFAPSSDSQEALADATGSGASVTVTISPYQASSTAPETPNRPLRAILQGSAPALTFVVLDDDGDPIDLTGKSLRFLAYYQEGNTQTPAFKYQTSGNGITIGGVDNNNVIVQLIATDTNITKGGLKYVLWNVTDNVGLAEGEFPIKLIPKDVP